MDKINCVSAATRIAELASLASALERVYESREITKPIVNTLMKDVIKLRSQLVSSSSNVKKTISLTAVDKKRDREVSDLNKVLKGCEAMKSEVVSSSAKAVREKIAKYYKGKITSRGFEEGSGMVMSLLNDLDSAEMKAYIEKIPGVAESIEAIREAQAEYIKTRDSQSEGQSEKTLSASSVKKELLFVLNDRLVPILNAAIIEEDADVMEFASAVGKEIVRVNNTVSARGKTSRKKAASAKTEPTETPAAQI